jgi:hypothetical protein
MPPRISKASPQTFRASRVARNFSVGVEDAQQRGGVLAAGLGPVERVRCQKTHRQRLLGRQHDFHQLAPAERQIDDAAAEHDAVGCDRHGVVMSATHQRGRFDAIGEPG